MPRPSRTVWALSLFVLAGCSLVTDFDRDRLGASPDEEDEAGVTTPDSHMDAHVRPAPGTDAGQDDPGMSAACETHADCGRNQLCCGGTCIVTTDAHCTDCEQGCSLATANQCNDRVCGCGSGAPCSGEKPYCQVNGRNAACVQCRDASDCERNGNGRTQCIQGTCAACDPSNNSGCSGTTPICNPATLTCEACTSSPDNCPGNPVCTPSGACGGCTANDMADCTNPTAPICNLTLNPTMCRGCMSDGECMSEWARPYCVNNQRCSTCRPSDDMGCVATSTTPDCRPNANGVYTCQGCQADSCGTGLRCNTQSGKCVACRDDNDCDTNSATPYCDTSSGTCRGCNTIGNQNASNLWCTANTLLARQVCDTGGRCVRCNASGAGCSTNSNSNAPRCLVDTAAPQNNMCVGCRPGVAGDCSGATPICDATSHRCRACAIGTQATDCPTAAAPVCNMATGSCARCLVGMRGTAAGCTGNQICTAGMNGPECSQCNANADCPDNNTPLCGPMHTCVACGAVSGNMGGSSGCSTKSSGVLPICTAAGSCAKCDTSNQNGCQITTELCCVTSDGPRCQPTGANQCTACGVPCDGVCANHMCVAAPDAGLPTITP